MMPSLDKDETAKEWGRKIDLGLKAKEKSAYSDIPMEWSRFVLH
jgi:hypothetical protein